MSQRLVAATLVAVAISTTGNATASDAVASMCARASMARACAEALGLHQSVRPSHAARTARAQAGSCDLQSIDDRCERWVSRYDHPNGAGQDGYEEVRALAISPDSARVYVHGHSYDDTTGNLDLTTVAFDSSGTRLWSATHAGPAGRADYAHDVTVSPDGARVFVVASEDNQPFQHGDYLTIAYDATTGTALWRARYDNGATEVPYTIAVSDDGARVYITGQSIQPGPQTADYDYATVAYDAATGAQIWVARYDGPAAGSYDAAFDLAVGGDTVYVTGFTGFAGFRTIAYDARTGVERWATDHDPTSEFDIGEHIAVSPDGSTVVVAGESAGGSPARDVPTVGDVDIVTVAYDAATGARLWDARHSTPMPGPDFPTGLVVAGARVFVAGQTRTMPVDLDFVTAAYDLTTGASLWSRTYSGPVWLDETVRGIGASPDGARVYVTGESADGFTQSWSVTLAYDAAGGDLVWSARHSEHAAGFSYLSPEALSVASDGSVYVAETFQYLEDRQTGEPLTGDRVSFGLVAYDH